MPRRKEDRTEAACKAEVMKRLRQYRGVLGLRHEDTATSGIPDITVTAGGKTTWWEAKYGRPDWDSHGLQELNMLRLEQFGFARYIIWQVDKNGENLQVSIVRPSELSQPDRWARKSGGFHYDWVVEYILGAHR